jgi:NADPH:quinone reductase-like Zn-dependent oxidoreductase
MKVIEIRDGFGLDRLAVAERPEPRPGPGQVLLRMGAASLNYRDLLTVKGLYNPKQPLPLVPCSDGAGQVVAVGEGVSRVAVGDRVATVFAQGWLSGEPDRDKLRSTLGGPLDGTLAELMLLDQDGVVRVPEHLSDEEAATLPCAAVTAWSALNTPGPARAGEVIVAQGTGGVSIFALQLGALLGARVIVTSSSDAKLERARELGAWATINYVEHPDWGREVRKLTGGRGADLVVEVGGAGTLAQSFDAVRIGGRIALIGVLSGTAAKIDVIPVLMKQVRVQGLLVGDREGFESMNRAIAQHELRPVVDRIFAFDEVRAALEHMADGKHLGKICIRF